MSLASRSADAFRWLVAFGAVSSAHAAAVVLVLHEPVLPVPDEAGGIMVVELAPVAASAPMPPVELPPGVLSNDSVEAQAVAPSTAAEPPTPEPELPSLPEVETAPPELALPKPVEKPPELPPEKQEEEKKQSAEAQAASVASVAAAPPPIEAPAIAEKPAAPDAGVTKRDLRLRAQWQGALSAHIARHARFPSSVRRQKHERDAIVRFRVDRRGHLVSVDIAQSSGSDELDGEAQAMIRRANPLPLPPHEVRSQDLEIFVPVKFRAAR